MISDKLSSVAQFNWILDPLSTRPEIELLKSSVWWERRETTIDDAIAIANNCSNSRSAAEEAEIAFCLALSVLSTGDQRSAKKYIDKLLSYRDISLDLVNWLNIEILGRSRKYKQQAILVSKILNRINGEIPDWIATACLLSLSHKGVDVSYLLKILPVNLSMRSPLLAALRARLLAGAGRPELAINLLEAALKKWSDSGVLLWLQGTLLAQTDKSNYANNFFYRSLKSKNTVFDIPSLRFWLADLLSIPEKNLPIDGTFDVVYFEISRYVNSDFRQSAELASFQLIKFWIQNKLKDAHDLLSKYHKYQDMPNKPEDKAAQIFMRYILYLLIYRQKNPDYYMPQRNYRALHVIGESHSLSVANSFFQLSDENFIGISDFIMGIKMHHLKNNSINSWRSRFHSRIKDIPDGDALMITIGEIDTRPDEGIFKYHKITGKKISSIVNKTVSEYVDFLANSLAANKFSKIIIQGIPAPNYDLSKNISINDMPLFVHMFKEINNLLRIKVKENDWDFLDVYSATCDENGKSNGKWHLDSYHLQPGFYRYANDWIL